MRILYYAMGGGLGHLIRAGAFLRTQLQAGRAVVLTASRYADDARVVRGFDVVRVPDELQHDLPGYRTWLTARIADLSPDLFCVDSFPGGILGELCDFAPLTTTPAWHLARLLRWPEYAKSLRGAPPRYAKTWRLETLAPAHERFLESCSDEICDLILDYESEPANAADIPGDRFWLVVHSDPAEEVAELIAYATELRDIERAPVRIVIATQSETAGLPDDCVVNNTIPAAALFPHAERIISAAGFNVVQQALPYRGRHTVVPFPRRYDDQFARAARIASQRDTPRAGQTRDAHHVVGV